MTRKPHPRLFCRRNNRLEKQPQVLAQRGGVERGIVLKHVPKVVKAEPKLNAGKEIEGLPREGGLLRAGLGPPEFFSEDNLIARPVFFRSIALQREQIEGGELHRIIA